MKIKIIPYVLVSSICSAGIFERQISEDVCFPFVQNIDVREFPTNTVEYSEIEIPVDINIDFNMNEISFYKEVFSFIGNCDFMHMNSFFTEYVGN